MAEAAEVNQMVRMITMLSVFLIFIAAGIGFVAWYRIQKGFKTCPYCAEQIKKAAKVCRYCRRDVASVEIENKTPRGLFSD